jgi:hypothetical protein
MYLTEKPPGLRDPYGVLPHKIQGGGEKMKNLKTLILLNVGKSIFLYIKKQTTSILNYLYKRQKEINT